MHDVQGGSTWDNATLRGLPDTAPDCEGSMASSLITRKDPTDGKLYNTTCFYVSSPVRSLQPVQLVPDPSDIQILSSVIMSAI